MLNILNKLEKNKLKVKEKVESKKKMKENEKQEIINYFYEEN